MHGGTAPRHEEGPRALDVALCFGWIDGQRRSDDADRLMKARTPEERGRRLTAAVADLAAGRKVR